MLLIYSKNADDFVNEVIDCLNIDFIRIGDREEILIDEICINDVNDTFKVSGEFIDNMDIEGVKVIWYLDGFLCVDIN